MSGARVEKFSERIKVDAPQKEKDDDSEYKPISAAMMLRLLRWLKPHRKLYTFGAVCGVLSLMLDLSSPEFIQRITDLAIPGKDYQEILRLALLWGGVTLGALILDAIQIGASRRCGELVIDAMRRAVFAQLQRLTMSYYDRTKLGRILTRGTSDMDALREPVISGINTVALNILMMLGAAALILNTDWRLFLAVCWLAPVMAYCNHIYRKKIGVQHQIARDGYSRVSSNLAENVVGVRVVSAFNRQDENLERFNELQEENTRNNVAVANIAGIYQPFLEFIKFSGQAIILAYGGALIMENKLSAGQVIKVFFYWDFYMRPTVTMGNFYNTLMAAMASCERLFGLLDIVPALQDKPGAKPIPHIKGHVIFEHLTFGYNPDRPVLQDICLEIPAGKTFALVGATGSGKSSTVSLLARFYEFQAGSIRVDGVDIRDVTMQSLHKQMGLVLQSNYLFTGSVLDNIRYPRPESSAEDVYNAAKSLSLHDTFLALPDGYLTKVGERGSSVSLGLRQLICFTRVLLANPSIFLLDEATSSIDTVTEIKIQSALEKLVRGRTTIIVAHRLSTIVKADCIVVLEHGRIIEQGTHLELVAAKRHYANLYERFVAQTQG